MSSIPPGVPRAPQGNVPAIGVPNSQDIPRLVFSAPYFEQVPLAEMIAPTVTEAVEAQLPSLVPPYVDDAAQAAVAQLAVLLTGSSMSGALYLNPVMPTMPAQAASMAYVDAMVATAGVPEVPLVPIGQVWARTVGQWVPITAEGGNFLPLSGGTMGGPINMSGNQITNLGPVPALPNGAAPAQWVLQQIASISLYQGTWDADSNVPDLTMPGRWQNGYTWIALTASTSGVVVTQPIPGVQGTTVYNADTLIYSTVEGQFNVLHSAGLTLAEIEGLFLALSGGQMAGPLLLNSDPTSNMQATTMQWVLAQIASSVFPEPNPDGQNYGRNGLQQAWFPVLSITGGVLTGPLTLSGNVAGALQAVPYQQVQSLVAAGTAGYLPLSGGVITGNLTVNGTLTGYLPLAGGTLSGALLVSGNAGALPAPPTNPSRLVVSGADNEIAALLIQNFGGATPRSRLDFRKARGTMASPSAVLNNDVLVEMRCLGYMTTGYSGTAASIAVSAAGDWTDASTPTTLTIGVNPAGAPGYPLTALTLTGAGDLTIRGGASLLAGVVTVGPIPGQVESGMMVNGVAQVQGATGYFRFLDQLSGFPWILYSSGGTAFFGNENAATMFQFGATGDFVIGGSNAVKATGTAWANPSDSRIKHDVADYAGGLAQILALRPVTYQLNGLAGMPSGDRRYHGLMAEEVEPVMPEMVGRMMVKLHPEDEQETEILTLDTTAMVLALVNAVKQLDERMTQAEHHRRGR